MPMLMYRQAPKQRILGGSSFHFPGTAQMSNFSEASTFPSERSMPAIAEGILLVPLLAHETDLPGRPDDVCL
jgi:hypothetical protein